MKTDRRAFLRLAGAAVLLPALPARAAQPVPPGTVVILQFMQDVNSKTAQVGDRVKLRVYADVVVNGKTLVRQDAPVTGIITHVKKPGVFGKRAELKMRLEGVKDVNGRRVPLEAYNSGNRFKASGPGAAGAGLIVLGPVGLLGGLFIHGNHITVKEGTKIQAEVPGAPRPPRKEDFPPVEPP